MAVVFTVVMFSSIGLPGLNGFVGEFLILIGSFVTRRWWAVTAAVGVVLAAVYLLWAYQRVFHGTPEGDNADLHDMTLRERVVMAPLLILIVFLGVYPQPVLERINPSVDRLIEHIEEKGGYRQPAVAAEGKEGLHEQHDKEEAEAKEAKDKEAEKRLEEFRKAEDKARSGGQ
ncbi:MAG: hypothetical protein M3396_02910, partial [Actinomycetota bacterium]|nr:hypothetical protein [Actinomycetota bacterium]